MKRIFIIVLLLALIAGCSNNYYSVKHVTSKNRNRYYDRSKDKGKKRTKIVSKKIVRQKGVAKKAKTKSKPEKPEEAIPHESDTTGFIP